MGRPGLSLDKKFRRLAHELDDFQAGFGRVLARGSLELLWDTAYESCTDEMGDAFDVEAAAEWRGPSGRLVKALLEAGGAGKAGFIEEGGSQFWPEGEPGTYRVHDLWDHAPEYARKRAVREEEREKKGKTIKQMRAEAGRKGAAKTNANRPANGQPTSGRRPANVSTLAEEQAATVSTPAGTPAPAPAPLTTTPAELSPAEARWPLVAACLMALWERKRDALWPSGDNAEDTCDQLERLISALPLAEAIDRLDASLEADPAHPWLGWHKPALKAKPKPRAFRGDRWQDRLTPDEFHQAHAELRALHPDLEAAPLGCTGDPAIHPVEQIAELNERWRKVAEARS